MDENLTETVGSGVVAAGATTAVADETPPGGFNPAALLIPFWWCLGMRLWLWAVAVLIVPFAALFAVCLACPPVGAIMRGFLSDFSALLTFVVANILVSAFWLYVCLFAVVGLLVTTPVAATSGLPLRESTPPVVFLAALLAVALLMLAIALYLGFRGNRLAWKSRRFKSRQHFRVVQLAWAAASILLVPLGLALSMEMPRLLK